MRAWLYSVAGLAGFLVVSYAAVRWLLPLVAPFVLAALVAEVLAPVVAVLTRPLGRWRLPRTLATALVLLVVAAVLLTLSTLAVARLVRELRELSAVLPAHYEGLRRLALEQAAQLTAFSRTLPASVQEYLQVLFARGQELLQNSLPAMLGAVQAFAAVPRLAADILIMWIAAFFLLRDREAIGGFLIGLFPADMRLPVRRVRASVWSAVVGVARAQAVLISLAAIISVAGLALIGSGYALSAGLLIGLADVLPVLGPGAIYVPWAVYNLVTGQVLFGVKLLVLYGLVAITRQFLEPRLMGDAMGLHPLAILISLYLGFTFFGPLGLVIGPLLATLLKALVHSELLPIFRNRQ